MPSMTLLPEKENQTPPVQPSRSNALNYLYVLTTLLSTAVLIVVQIYRSLPQWFLVVAVAFYAIGLFVIVLPTIHTYAQQFRENRHRKAIANRFFPELHHLAQQFSKYVDPPEPITLNTYSLKLAND